jgi:ATP-dependent RNA helicase DDX47/RRP3
LYSFRYDVEIYQRLEALLGTKLPEYASDEETVLVMLERVTEAQRIAGRELRETMATSKGNGKGGKRKGRGGEDDDENGDSYVRDVDVVKKAKGGKGKGKGKGKY